MVDQTGKKNPNWKGGKSSHSCDWCGESFRAYGTQRFCSRVCYNEYKASKTILVTCSMCGKEFKDHVCNKDKYSKRYCSRGCVYADHEYRTEISKKGGRAGANKRWGGKAWRTYRKRAIDAYGTTCGVCGITYDEDDVVVHHKNGKNYPGSDHSLDNLMIMCRRCHNQLAPLHAKILGDQKVEQAVSKMIQSLGLDPEDPNLKDTPRRIATLFEEMFSGIDPNNAPNITLFDNEDPAYDQIVSTGADFMSMCSHHFMPFFGSAYFGYIPGKKVIGLSKIRRVIQYFAHRPQLQERLTEQVIELLDSILQPKGCMLVMKARHMCVILKDPSQLNTETVTSAVRGCFREAAVKQEFLSLIQKPT